MIGAVLFCPASKGATIKKEECMKEPSRVTGDGFFIGWAPKNYSVYNIYRWGI